MRECFFRDYYERGDDDGVAGGGRRHLGLHGEFQLHAWRRGREGGATCHHAMALGMDGHMAWASTFFPGPLKTWIATIKK
jgi:hypothetical protein